MNNKSIASILEMASERGRKPHVEKEYKLYSKEEQEERLKDHLIWMAEHEEKSNEITVGSFVKRNRLGMKVYALPQKNQIAMIIKRFERCNATEGNAETYPNAIIAIVIEGKEVMTYPVDLNYYEKA